MHKEIRSLLRLRSLIFGLGMVLFIFSLVGFFVMDLYLYSILAGERLDILTRTKGYRLNLIKACISIRKIYALANSSDPTSEAVIMQARADLESVSESLLTVHTMNYVSSSSGRMLNFFVESNSVEKIAMPGTGEFVLKNVSFWDLGNHFILSTAFTSQITIHDLTESDLQVDTLSVNKRAAVFM
jgi:hypothetical protein